MDVLDQCSSWSSPRIYPRPLLVLIYIYDLADSLPSNLKLFVDDTSLLSVVHDVNASARELNDDLKKINKWAFLWKMSFKPDPTWPILESKGMSAIIQKKGTKKAKKC